jgi:hypothetical protein
MLIRETDSKTRSPEKQGINREMKNHQPHSRVVACVVLYY